MLLAGGFAHDAGWSPAESASRLAGAACRYPHLAPRQIVGHDRLACYVIERAGRPTGVMVLSPTPEQDVVVVGHVTGGAEDVGHLAERLRRDGPSVLFELDGVWTALIHDRPASRLSLVSDRIGTAWVYVARVAGGFLFCSDFGALVSTVPHAPRVDWSTTLGEIAWLYLPDDRTVYEGITLLPAGEVVELTAGGVRTVLRRRVEYGDRFASLDRRRKFELLDELLSEAYRRWCAPHQHDVALSLSAGYDSRYGLALSMKYGSAPRCFTFGHPRSREVQDARAVARRAGLTTTVFPVDPSDWTSWRRCVEQLGVSAMIQWSGWAEGWLALLRRERRAVMTGYLGDILSGNVHTRAEGYVVDGRAYVKRALEYFGWLASPFMRPGVRRQAERDFTDRLEECRRRASFVTRQQEPLHLSLCGRTRRGSAAQVNLIARFLTPVTYFYSRRMIEFWSNVGYEDVKDQALYLDYAQDRFPALFPPPHATPPARAFKRLAIDAIRTLCPPLDPVVQPPVIDRRAMIRRNRPHIRDLVKRRLPMLEPWFDVKALEQAIIAFPRAESITALDLVRLVNALILLDIPRPTGQAPPQIVPRG